MNDARKSEGDTLAELVQEARRLGADAAEILTIENVTVDDSLVNMCRDSKCEFYGVSINCPPHVSGPSGFREIAKDYHQALVFKIDVPTESLMSENRRTFFQRLQEIAAGTEIKAAVLGYAKAKGFAGGSCKDIFCSAHEDCQVLTEGKPCRHPDKARPSMSGYGINVSALTKAAGWEMSRITRDTDPAAVSMAMLCGLILLD